MTHTKPFHNRTQAYPSPQTHLPPSLLPYFKHWPKHSIQTWVPLSTQNAFPTIEALPISVSTSREKQPFLTLWPGSRHARHHANCKGRMLADHSFATELCVCCITILPPPLREAVSFPTQGRQPLSRCTCTAMGLRKHTKKDGGWLSGITHGGVEIKAYLKLL